MKTIKESIGKRIRISLFSETGRVGSVVFTPETGYLDEVWVVPQHRGEGIGTQLAGLALAHGCTHAIVANEWMGAILAKKGWRMISGSLWGLKSLPNNWIPAW